jgi:hypothetical protein
MSSPYYLSLDALSLTMRRSARLCNMVQDFYLVQAKKPSESKYAWDYFKVLTIPGEKAFLPPSKSRCPLVEDPR